jgi:hypothetical protein
MNGEPDVVLTMAACDCVCFCLLAAVWLLLCVPSVGMAGLRVGEIGAETTVSPSRRSLFFMVCGCVLLAVVRLGAMIDVGTQSGNLGSISRRRSMRCSIRR